MFGWLYGKSGLGSWCSIDGNGRHCGTVAHKLSTWLQFLPFLFVWQLWSFHYFQGCHLQTRFIPLPGKGRRCKLISSSSCTLTVYRNSVFMFYLYLVIGCKFESCYTETMSTRQFWGIVHYTGNVWLLQLDLRKLQLSIQAMGGLITVCFHFVPLCEERTLM